MKRVPPPQPVSDEEGALQAGTFQLNPSADALRQAQRRKVRLYALIAAVVVFVAVTLLRRAFHT